MIISNVNLGDKICSIKTVDGKINEIVEGIDPKGIDCGGHTVMPGLIDIHTHGMLGMDTMDADFSKMCMDYALAGTTSLLPTTMTMGIGSLHAVDNAKTDFRGANILGFHFEGPYISPKYKGAQNPEYIKKPSIEEFDSFKNIKMITVAPEVEGCLEFIKKASKGCAVALGHTDCDYEDAVAAIEVGANCLTHTFNAMPPIHHRNGGPIVAAAEKGIYAQIICDGFHISPAVVMLAYKIFGEDRMILISDSIRPAKMPEGKYESGGLEVEVKDRTIRLKDGTIAGSYNTLMDCVKKAVEIGIPKSSAIKMASENPARLLGVKKGKIDVGYDSDLIVVDDKLKVLKVFIGEEEIL